MSDAELERRFRALMGTSAEPPPSDEEFAARIHQLPGGMPAAATAAPSGMNARQRVATADHAMDPRRLVPTIAGLNAAQRTAIHERDFIASMEELRAIPFELLDQRIRISLSPDGNIVPLRSNYMTQVTACHRGQMYNDDWLRFSGGAMHFLTQAGARCRPPSDT